MWMVASQLSPTRQNARATARRSAGRTRSRADWVLTVLGGTLALVALAAAILAVRVGVYAWSHSDQPMFRELVARIG